MADVFNRISEAVGFEFVTRALLVVLLLTAILALWEIIRYVRALRQERELARRLTMQQVYGSANDPRYSDPQAYVPQRSGFFGRFMRRTVQTVGVVAILLLVVAAISMPFLDSWLERQDHVEKADYIVPLPGDNERLLKAADLFKQGFAPRVVLSRELSPSAGGADTIDSQMRVLEKSGVSRAAMTALDGTPATIPDIAESLKRLTEGRRTKVIVVGSGIQSLRTKVIFEDVVPRARFMVVSPAVPGGEQRPWWRNQETALRTISEATQLAHYWIGSSLRTLQTEPEMPTGTVAPPKPADNLSVGSGPQRP